MADFQNYSRDLRKFLHPAAQASSPFKSSVFTVGSKLNLELHSLIELARTQFLLSFQKSFEEKIDACLLSVLCLINQLFIRIFTPYEL